jgi:hypothetical protein
VILAPILALSLLGKAPWSLRPILQRLPAFAAMFAACVALAGFYNFWRWGSPFDLGASPGPGPQIWGSPVLGVLGLLVSPGKGILWYSPVVVLQLWSLHAFWRRNPSLVLTASVLAGAHVLYIGCLRFYGGDWCWGPRYLVMTLPLLSLGLPFLRLESPIRRRCVRVVVTVGLVVQLLGVSIEHQGFFFAQGLAPWFWTDQSFNYRHSQLAYRIHEVHGLFTGVRARRDLPFAPGPYTTLATYCIFGTEPAREPEWMEDFPVFYVPRAWPLWIPRLPPGSRPVPPFATAGLLVLLGCWSGLRIRRAWRAMGLATKQTA